MVDLVNMLEQKIKISAKVACRNIISASVDS